VIDEIVPSGSAAVKAAVTKTPVLTGFGETFVTLTTGDRSLIISVVMPEPGPAAFVAVTMIVNV
jgi:hypothetical protein